MGLIREPKDIDFSGQSKPLTEKELQDFRKLMIELKAKNLPNWQAKNQAKVG